MIQFLTVLESRRRSEVVLIFLCSPKNWWDRQFRNHSRLRSNGNNDVAIEELYQVCRSQCQAAQPSGEPSNNATDTKQ